MTKRMLLMLALVVAVIGALGFIKYRQISMAIAMGKSFSPPPEAVTTVVVSPQAWQPAVEATGSVAAVQGVTLSADLPGVVDKVNFQSGSRVAAGQVLVQLDTRQEHAQLASAQAAHDLAISKLERSKKLLEKELIAQADFDDIASQAKQSEAALTEIQASIDRKTIRAPFAGVTGIRMVNVGQYMRSGDPIVPLQSLDPIYVNFSVPQQQVAQVHVGALVEAASDSGAGVAGRITAINPVVDEATRNVQVQATFHNAHDVLRAGAYVNVRVSVGQTRTQLAIPTSAVNYAPYGNSVFIVQKMKDPKGKDYLGVRQQFVELGASRGDQVAVVTGVEPGQEIVTSGVFKLRPNAAVKVDNSVQPSNSAAPHPANS